MTDPQCPNVAGPQPAAPMDIDPDPAIAVSSPINNKPAAGPMSIDPNPANAVSSRINNKRSSPSTAIDADPTPHKLQKSLPTMANDQRIDGPPVPQSDYPVHAHASQSASLTKPILTLQKLFSEKCLMERKVGDKTVQYLKFDKCSFLGVAVSRIFIRQCYSDVFTKLCEILTTTTQNGTVMRPDDDANRRHPVVILGTAGIGKSMMLFYLVHRFLMLDLNVLLTLGINPSHFYLNSEDKSVRQLTVVEVNNICMEQSEKDVHLYDVTADTPPNDSSMATVIISSPREGRVKEPLKADNALELYQYVWEDDEFELLQKFLEKTDCEERRRIYGNIPRSVFSNNNHDWMGDALSNNKPLGSIVEILTNNGSGSRCIYHLNDHLIHIVRPTDGKAPYQLQFASAYVAREVGQRAFHEIKKLARDLMAVAGSTSFMRASAGPLFEPFIFEFLQRKHRPLVVRQLQSHTDSADPPSEEVKLHFTQLKNFNKLSDMECIENNVLYVPEARNLESLDALGVMNWNGTDTVVLLQITVSPNHPIKKRGINNVLEMLKRVRRDKLDVKFVFAVPNYDELFTKYRKQPVHGASRNVLQKGVPECLQTQYVVEFPVVADVASSS